MGSGGGTTINYPQQPTYGEGMAEAMQAQMQQLLGQGEYATMYSDAGFDGGDLGDIITGVEAPIRQKTAQVDTDVLRQTLLGNQTKVVKDPETGKYGIPGAELVKGEDGKVKQTDGGRFQTVMVENYRTDKVSGRKGTYVYTPKYQIIDTETGATKQVGGHQLDWYPDSHINGPFGTKNVKIDNIANLFGSDSSGQYSEINGRDEFTETFNELNGIVEKSGEDAAAQQFDFTNPYTGKPLKEGEVVREGDGMIDLLGDKRKALDPTTGLESDRQAGFDAEGNFLGLSALAEDIQRGNLSRQREADLADVERLSDRYSTLMDEFKPGTQEALSNASEVLDAQKDSLTGAGAIKLPIDSIYGGDLDTTTMQAAQVADPLKLSANTTLSGEAGLGQVLNNKVDQGGRRVAYNEDSLRSQLLGDAKDALGQGLTDRETRAIQDSARARSTMMGRTFDQSGAIAESEARVLEDNNRRMQNRAFAQSVLGQEAGLQQGDLTRGMAQESEQAGMQQQTNLAQAQLDQQANAFDADSAMRAATINQGQKQQAKQFEVGATMDAQRLNEQLKQAGTLGYIDATTRLAAMEDQYTLDPFQAILGRASGGSLQAGQGVFGQAGYGLNSGPQYLNPEAGLGYISQMAANDANMYAAQQAANANRTAGIFGGLGSLVGSGIGAFGALS